MAKTWERVPRGLPLDVVAGKRFKKREARMKDPLFLASCEFSNTKPTKRQARKWNNKKGIAFQNRLQARSLL
jgi:hypothetical protein